jgi:predicted thioesterase
MSTATFRIGSTASAELVVGPEDTATAIALSEADSFPAVFATSRMIALMEIAAARLMAPILEVGQLSVGVSVNVRHTAASPVGSTVRAVATFLGEDGKLFLFRVDAEDDAGPVGSGEHSRAVVSSERILNGAARRIASLR